MNYDLLKKSLDLIQAAWPQAKPSFGFILGSGWSEVVESFQVKDTIPYGKIPGLGTPGVIGHTGRLAWVKLKHMDGFIFQGRRHWYEGEGWTPIALPVYVLKHLKAEILLLTNAAGGIREDLKPGDLMVITDHINLMSGNPLIGPHIPLWGPRFPDQSCVYDPGLRETLGKSARTIGENLKQGVYLASSGPTYETPAEIHAFKTLGADAVGMSTVPEAILANSAGLKVAGISCITNFAAGISKTKLTHEEVTATTLAAMARMKALLLQFAKDLSGE